MRKSLAEVKSEYLRDGRSPIPSSEVTSRVMRANKAKNTTPEIQLRKALIRAGIRGYRLHLKTLPGRPDIAFTKKKVALFVNGCFWHRCPHCELTLPKSNIDFWVAKFNRNTTRDIAKIQRLQELGWKVVIIWECEIKKDLDGKLSEIEQILKSSTD